MPTSELLMRWLDGEPIFKSLSTSTYFLCALSHSEKVLWVGEGPESEVKAKCLEIPALSPTLCSALSLALPAVALVVTITSASLSPSQFFQLTQCSSSAPSPP